MKLDYVSPHAGSFKKQEFVKHANPLDISAVPVFEVQPTRLPKSGCKSRHTVERKKKIGGAHLHRI